MTLTLKRVWAAQSKMERKKKCYVKMYGKKAIEDGTINDRDFLRQGKEKAE
jgi:hypothetical protein